MAPVYYPLNAGTHLVEATVVTSDTVTQFQGRIQKAAWLNGNLNILIQDALKNLSWAKFVWDYNNMGSALGGTEWYGTVNGLKGTNIYYDDAYAKPYIGRTIKASGDWTEFDGNAYGIWGTSEAAAVRSSLAARWKGWRRLVDLDVVPDDFFMPGDILKFSPSNFSDAEAGATLADYPSYQVRGGTVIANNGTIEVSPALLLNDVGDGYFIYVRRPLFFSGNPADIIWNMLTGSNTDVDWDNAKNGSNIDIDYGKWIDSRKSLVPLGHAEFYREIIEEDRGAVIGAIQEVSQDCLANAFIDNENRFVWKSYHPRSVPVGTDVDHFHQATAVADLIYSEDIDDIWTKVSLSYGYQPDEPDPRFTYSGKYDRVDAAAAAQFYDLNKVKDWKSYWIHDRNFARQQVIRFMRRYAEGPSRVVFDSSLYGLTGTVSGFMGVTHRTGSLATTVYEISRTVRRFGERSVVLEGLNASDLYYGQGFGFWEENWDGGTGPGTSTATLWPQAVSGTSTFGWGTNLTDGTTPIGTEGTCFNIDTTVYGTIYKWW